MKKSLADLLEAHPVPKQKEKPPYKIYCDMDGVLTDFESRFEHYAGMQPKAYENKYGEAAFWELIDGKIGERFWSGMPWMSRGKELWNLIKDYNPSILTSPSRNQVSRDGKQSWVDSHLSPTPEVIFAFSERFKNARTKSFYSNENSILIDDRDDNINNWIAKGGIGLQVHNGNITPVLEKLHELGYE